MKKTVFAVILLVAVATAGFVAGSKWHNPPQRVALPAATATGNAAVPFSYQTPPPAITSAEAKSHRDSHYREMTTIDNVLELPTDFAQTEALYTIAGRANAAELEQYIHQSLLITDRYDRRAALDILFSRYVELDPQAATDFLLLIDLDIDDVIIGGVFQQWAKIDLDGAISAANQIANIRQRKYAGNAILRSMARRDPGMLEAVAARLADRHKLAFMEAEAIGLRANYDPRTALTEALTMKHANGRWDAIRRVGHVWARNDPATAITFAADIDDPRMREQFVSSVIDRWMGDDPEAAIASIMANPVLQERDQQLRHGLMRYTESNPENALALAAQLSGPAQTMAYQSVFSAWLSQDPDAALQELAALGNSPLKRTLTAQVGQILVSVDPDAALRWVDTLDSGQRARYLPDILGQMTQSDPQRALDAALASDAQGNTQQALSRVLHHLSHSDPQLALQYVAGLPAGHERDNLYQTLAGNLATRDAQSAIAWVSTLSGQSYLSAVSGMAGAMAQSDPDLAASIVAQAPDAARGQLIQQISMTISYQDPQSALDWLGRFKNDPAHDAAAASIAGNLAQKDPQYALRIADGLASEQRQQATQNILLNWTLLDPVAASRWAADSHASQRPQAIGAVTRAWADTDPAAASRWVRSLRSGDAKDQGLVILATNASFDPRATSDLINAIDSAEKRERAILGAYLRLRQQYDNTAAAQLLDSVDASEGLRLQLRRYAGG